MSKQLRRAAGALGLQIGPADRWSTWVDDYYPVEPRPRWGHGKPAHPELERVLEAGADAFRSTLRALCAQADSLQGIALTHDSARPLSPAWENGWFESLDAASLVGLLCQWKPRRYVEIGSGNSTIFARHAITSAGLSTTLTSIDPQPRAGIDALCDAIHRTPLEAADLALATGLEPGDVLFFDGSHRAFQNSDVVVFFLEVLPRLKPGILVHIHDMFLPDDYPPKWARRLYSEQYMLAAMMVHGQAPFEIVLPVHYVSTRPQFAAAVEAVFQGADGRTMPGARPRGATEILGSSFWLKTI